ncbi:hypothetical protein OG887_01440 [Streptomyces sp. NBC_00053]|uniref:hypothetical protein n=1 Tax=unclassified Streptomyces TaxID=2593676 RepID=UPI00224E0972|nr:MULTISPECIES: hypothetical protein [unclassified Streptomyces]MCX5498106.1 hypothetical protein [Streptomyces sp. NBC_00052]MCX5553362.1 hypothetical protein [Streptomyces sp. NBC_00051]
MVDSDDLALASVGSGGRTFDYKAIAEVSSHDRHRSSSFRCTQTATHGVPPHEEESTMPWGRVGRSLGSTGPEGEPGRHDRGRLVPDPLGT